MEVCPFISPILGDFGAWRRIQRLPSEPCVLSQRVHPSGPFSRTSSEAKIGVNSPYSANSCSVCLHVRAKLFSEAAMKWQEITCIPSLPLQGVFGLLKKLFKMLVVFGSKECRFGVKRLSHVEATHKVIKAGTDAGLYLLGNTLLIFCR